MAIAPITSTGHVPASESVGAPSASQSGGGVFARVIERLLDKATVENAAADQAVQDLALGKTDNVHNVLLTAARADLSFRLVLEIRNRLTEALQEILRMQV